MASSVSIQLKGVDGLKAKVLNLIPRVRQGTQQAVAQTALLMEGTAKQLAPVKTGRLRASIHSDIAPDGLSATVADGVTYGVNLEFGTRYISPRPFLFPAYEAHRSDFIRLLKENTKLF